MCNLRLYQLVELKILHIKPLSWLLGFIWSNKGCPYYWREVWQKLGNNGINRELGRKRDMFKGTREHATSQPPWDALCNRPSRLLCFCPSFYFVFIVCLSVRLPVCLSFINYLSLSLSSNFSISLNVKTLLWDCDHVSLYSL